jgi:hypothetical protein
VLTATATSTPRGVVEGATENAAVCQALLDNMVGRGLDPAVCRLFIIDGSRALPKAMRLLMTETLPLAGWLMPWMVTLSATFGA